MRDEEAYRLNRARVRSAFDRASTSYEGAAVLQARVADELLERLDTFHFHPQVVVDLGAGTGRATAELKRRYPKALVIAMDLAPGMLREAQRHQGWWRSFQRVCADAHRLPLASGSVDLVFSSLMLQWCDLDPVFMEVRRVLKPEGFMTFSSFGPDTLRELRDAWARADERADQRVDERAGAGTTDTGSEEDAVTSPPPTHVSQFIDMHDVGDALVRAGLMEPVLDVDRMQVTYPDTMALMRDLKAIGARNATAGRSRSLTGKARLARLAAAYETYRRDGRLPATYEVVYGAAWGSAGRQGVPAFEGEARIDPGMIKRRKR